MPKINIVGLNYLLPISFYVQFLCNYSGQDKIKASFDVSRRISSC